MLKIKPDCVALVNILTDLCKFGNVGLLWYFPSRILETITIKGGVMSEQDETVKDKTRFTLYERLNVLEYGWGVSPELFGDVGVNIYDFQAHNYVYFLDHVTSKEELIRGLRELSPLADDALDVAEKMDDRAFARFKHALKRERSPVYGDGRNSMPLRYGVLLLPRRFLEALPLTEEYDVSLGVVLIRIMEKQSRP